MWSRALIVVVQHHFRVLEISEKYYNKWFVSPAAAKKWKNEKNIQDKRENAEIQCCWRIL